MGILEDMGLDFGVPATDSPAFDQFEQGTVPQPGMLESLGFDFESMINQPPTPQAEAESQGDYLGAMGLDFSNGNFQYPQEQAEAVPTETPELSLSRLGGSFIEGIKDTGRQLTDFLQGVNVAANRLKKEIPFYQDDGAMKKFVDFAMKYHPILGPLTNAEFGEALYRLGKSEVLATDPEYMNSSGWLEDFFRSGPQIGAMVLANLMSGGTAAMTTMGMMIAGGTYRNAVDAGTDPEKAMAWGIANAIIQAPLEQLGLTKALSFWKPRKSIVMGIKDIAEIIGTEWLTEFTQSFPDEFINIFSTQPDKPMLDKTAEFISKLGDIAKQGAYEGTLTAPWSLLTGGAGWAWNKYRPGRPKPTDETNKGASEQGGEEPPPVVPPGPPAPQFTTEPYEEFSPEDLETLAQMGGREAQIPANMTPEEYTAQLLEHIGNVDFDQEFAKRGEGMKEQQGAAAEAMKKAMEAAEIAEKEKYLELEFEKRQAEYDTFLKHRKAANKARAQYEKQHRVDRQLQQELAERRKSIQEALNYIKSEDMEAVTPRAIPKADYEKLRSALGERVADFYKADISLIPPSHRAAFNLLEREAHEGEPRSTAYVNELGAKDNANGTITAKGSTYPAWFRKKFAAGANPKYVFSIRDFDQLMHKLKNGLTLTDRQNQMFERLLEVSKEKQQKEPELFQAEDVATLEEEGYEILAGRPMPWGAVGAGNWIVVQDSDGGWDDYQMVGEENGEAIFANKTKEFRKPVGETTSSIVAYRIDDEWIKQQYKEAGKGVFKDTVEGDTDFGFGYNVEGAKSEAAPEGPLSEKERVELREGKKSLIDELGFIDDDLRVRSKQKIHDIMNQMRGYSGQPGDPMAAYNLWVLADQITGAVTRQDNMRRALDKGYKGKREFTQEQIDEHLARRVEPLLSTDLSAPEFSDWTPYKSNYPSEAGETAKPAAEAQTPAPQKKPIKERRKEPARIAWDAPFRSEWLSAQDLNEKDFLDYGEKKVAEKDGEFLQFAQRMGKTIEEDTPLIEALRIIHARVQAGMMPSKLTSEMTGEEAKKAADTDWLTGLRNKRAFDLDKRLKHLVAIDLDALKWINDNLGHHVGDAMLITFGDAMRASGLDASGLYHVSGDEYWMQHDNPGVLAKAIDAIEKYLDTHPLEVTYKGATIPYRLGASYGIGNTLRTAEAELRAAKTQRESGGERAERGAIPSQISKGLAAGGEVAPAADTGIEEAVPEGPGSYSLKLPRLTEKATYDQIQAAIDTVEDQLEAQGVPGEEWLNVPELNDLYRKRGRAEEVELVEGLSLIPGDTEINYTYLHAETGEKIKGRANAKEVLNEVDQQLDTYYSLLECLTNANR
jgi:GGDEF domain-containing protein